MNDKFFFFLCLVAFLRLVLALNHAYTFFIKVKNLGFPRQAALKIRSFILLPLGTQVLILVKVVIIAPQHGFHSRAVDGFPKS